MGKSLLFYRMMYNFRMPLFTFVSGFLMTYTTFCSGKESPTIPAFVRNKTKRLLIPFVILTIITFIPRALASYMTDDVIPLNFNAFIRSFFFPDSLIIPYFWFIQMSFLLLTFTYTILWFHRFNKANRTKYYMAFSIIVLSVYVFLPTTSFFSIDYVFKFGIFFIGGCIYCEYFDKINKTVNFTSPITLLASIIIWCCLFVIGENTWISMVASVFGIAMCVSLCQIMEKKGITVLNHLTGANYIIFLLSWYFNVLFQQVLSHYVVTPWFINSFLSFITGIYIPWMIYKYLQLHSNYKWVRTTAFLLGQRLPLPRNTGK